MRQIVRLLLSLGVLSSIALPARAEAYERQWHAGGGLGYVGFGTLQDPVYTLHGVGVSGHLTYGLNDMFNLMAEVNASGEFGPSPWGRRVLTGGSVGASYVIDVLQIVPYAGLMVGGYGVFATGPCGGVDQPACVGVRFAPTAIFGIDYQLSRSFALGAAIRGGPLFGGAQVEWTATAMLRAEYLWGY